MVKKTIIKSNEPVEWLWGWYVLMFIWWIAINVNGLENTNQNYFFGLIFGFIPLVGGIIGIKNAIAWGGIKSTMGRAVGGLSLGLISWAIGGLIWAYFNFTGIEVPYPSLADVAYLISWPLWTIGAIYLARATGAQISLQKIKGQAALFLVPLFVIIVSYYLLFNVARGGVIDLSGGGLKLFFDLAYPIGDIVILSISLLVFGLSFKYLGGRYHKPIILLLAGFVVNYLADFMFSWQTTLGTFYVAGSADLLFMTAMTLMSVGVIGLNPILARKPD